MHSWEGLSIPDARKGGTRHRDERRPGRDRRVQRRHEQRDEDDEGAQEVELDLEPGKYVRGCLLCYIFAEANGVALLKRLRCRSVCRSRLPLETGGDKGALSNPRKIRELSRGSPFSSSSSSHYHPIRITNAELKLNVTPGPRPSVLGSNRRPA